jgi:thiol-disulfide isomerase/thioredoxin
VNSEVLYRLAWAGGIILGGLGLYWLANFAILTRSGRNSPSTSGILRGHPSILYFTTPDCIPCKTVQRPAIQKVSAELGQRLQVVEVNAYEQPELARKWGVLSVPTTFIIDAQGKPRHVNHGVTRADKLLKQVSEVMH